MICFTAPYLLKDLIDKNRADVLHLYSRDCRAFSEPVPAVIPVGSYSFANPTPPYYSILIGKPSILSYFLSLKPPIATGDPASHFENGLTLLHVALLTHRSDCVRIILESPLGRTFVNLAVRDGEYSQWMPLALAIRLRDCDSISHLIAHGASPVIRQPPNTYPIRLALESGSRDLQNCLFESMREIRRDLLQEWFRRPYLDKGSPPIAYFKEQGAPDVVELLERFFEEGWTSERAFTQLCNECPDRTVTKCHVCGAYYCPFHIRSHKHEPVMTGDVPL
jgi:hypothetical protein